MNPDFGQVEVDPSVINLTAFETRYQERRPFFVEGGDLFRIGEGSTGGSTDGLLSCSTPAASDDPRRAQSLRRVCSPMGPPPRQSWAPQR